MKALIVDDSKVTRKIVTMAMQEAGFAECDEAEDGWVAATFAAKGQYDMIMMDWNMPKMSGIDSVKAIRAFNKVVPIVMVTTEAEKIRVIEALKAGANNYIAKPFTPEKLIEKVNETLRKCPRQ